MQISDETFEEIRITLMHARTFIDSRQKMHPTGVALYDELVETLDQMAPGSKLPFFMCEVEGRPDM